MSKRPIPPLEIRLRALSALDYAPRHFFFRERCQCVANQTFTDPLTQIPLPVYLAHPSTWYYRYKQHGLTCLERSPVPTSTTSARFSQPKLPKPLHEILPLLKPNQGRLYP